MGEDAATCSESPTQYYYPKYIRVRQWKEVGWLVGVLLGKYRAKGLKCKTHSEHRTFQDTIADTNKHFVSVNEEGILIRERQTQLRKSQKLYDTRISLFKLNGWMIFIGVHW